MKMKQIMLVNFKTYKEASGRNALNLAKICNEISRKKKIGIIVCVQAADINPVSKTVLIPVFAQHVDYFEQARSTGFILPEDIKDEGATGTLLNHSEHRIPFETIKKTVERCKNLNIKAVVCAASLQEVKKILKLKPYCIMFEDPKLVSTGKSITRIEPKAVKKFAEIVKKHNKNLKSKIISLCGAGISNKEDVKLALKLGCDGVGIASAIVKAKNKRKKILELLDF